MKSTKFLIYLACLVAFCSCGHEFLDIKRSKGQVVPAEVADFQAILDKWDAFNSGSSHRLGTIGSDEYYIGEEQWNLLTQPAEKNGYIWADDVYERQEVVDWNSAYHRILLANMVLDGLAKINPSHDEKEAWNNARGSALFHRAWNYYQLAQLFCKPYDTRTASTDMGIPLRLQPDVTLKLGRGTVEDVYQQVVADLREAINLLPVEQLNRMRPSKPAAYLLLARVFLQQGDYGSAWEYANKCLELKNTLLDFNKVNLVSNDLMPVDFGASNPEVLFFGYMDQMVIISTSHFHADTALLDLYGADDLRRAAYFRDVGGGRQVFKGSYAGALGFFTGMAVDEAYLIKAECDARANDVPAALEALNMLLRHRVDSDTFVPLFVQDSEELLALIVEERRKELLLRGVRWEDLRRLNREGRLGDELIRKIGDAVYSLKPGSDKWIWPLPEDEVVLGGLKQNDR